MEQLEFFEAIGIADQERVHTQFLAWLLAPRTTPLSDAQRVRLIRHLLGRNVTVDPGAPVAAMTEVRHMDLVLVTDRDVIVLENKVKSRLGREQLQIYDAAIRKLAAEANRKGLWAGDRQVHKVFLSLSGEVSANGWADRDYQDLADALNELQTSDPFVRSYRSYLRKLVKYRNDYVRNHIKHGRVEANAGLDSIDRFICARDATLSDLERFALETRLDTVFGEALLREVARQARAPGLHQVGETRGHALLETTFYEFKLAWRSGPYERPFRAGTQLQRDAFKLNIGAGDDYHISKREWIRPLGKV